MFLNFYTSKVKWPGDNSLSAGKIIFKKYFFCTEEAPQHCEKKT
jgi:hypothetical protein